MLTDDFREFIALLNQHEVKYMLIGGFAVAIHGYPRYTKDIDIFISNDPENAAKMLKVMQDFGFSSLGLTQADFQDSDIVQLGHEPNRIDLLKEVPGIRFDESFTNRLLFRFDNVQVSVVAKEDLIKAKEAAGRDQDLVDARKLRG
jgi:predicted nucleotidyltransferase